MATNLLTRTIEDVLREALSDASEELFVVNPGESLGVLIGVMKGIDTPAVRLLAADGNLRDTMEDFILASHAADLVDADALALRTFEGQSNTLLVGGGGVIAVVEAGDHVAGLATDERGFIEAAYESYEAEWERATPFSLRTPPLGRVQRTLRESLGAHVAGDFDAMLSTMDTARGDGDGLDEVTMALLVAAKNQELLYDISKWGEDVGVASKATFSRTKTELEAAGLIATEKVPIDVGRPRLRLVLGEASPQDPDAKLLATRAATLLH